MVLALTRTALACIALCAMPLAAAMELTDYSCSKRNTLAGLQRLIDTELSDGAHVNLRGQCSGRLLLRKDITISGDGRTRLQRAQPGVLLEVDHARVTLINLALSGGDSTILCHRGATCLLNGVRVDGATAAGVEVLDAAHIEFRESASSDNGGAGLRLDNGATATLRGTLTIAGNRGQGISLESLSGLADRGGKLVVSGNALAAIQADSSHLQLETAEISGSLVLRGNSQAVLGANVQAERIACEPLAGIRSSQLYCP